MSRNRLIISIAMAVLIIFAGIVGEGNAITLGYPDIFFDSRQGAGRGDFGAQGVNYDVATGFLTVNARAVSIFDGATDNPLVDGTIDYRVKLNSYSLTSGVVSGSFGTDEVFGYDLIITDDTGILLEGDFISYVLDGFINDNYGLGDAVFNVTGGSLASQFGNYGGIVHLEFDIAPVFSSLTFDSDFSGDVSGDIAPVPEPSTIFLLGAGLFGFGIACRRKGI